MNKINNIEELPIYVINLKRAKERRQLIKSRLDDLGLNFEFVDATDDKLPLTEGELDLVGRENLHKFPRKLAQGAVGCLISHLMCYKKILNSSAPYALILEDDATFTKDFLPVLKYIMQVPPQWNLMRLGYFSGIEGLTWCGMRILPLNLLYRKPIKIPPQDTNQRSFMGPLSLAIYGTHAYLITRYGCEFSLAKYMGMIQPIDDLMDCSAMPGHWGVAPIIVTQIPGTGYIDNPPRKFQPLNLNLTRGRPKPDMNVPPNRPILFKKRLFRLPIIKHIFKPGRFCRLRTVTSLLVHTKPPRSRYHFADPLQLNL